MSETELFIAEHQKLALNSKIQTLNSELEKSVAPDFYGAPLAKADFEEMLKFPKANELLAFVPSFDSFIRMHFGDGTNADVLCEGCDDYVYYTIYDKDFEESDGGQFDFNSYNSHYCEDIRKAAVDVINFAFTSFANPSENVKFIPLSTWI